MRTASDLGGQPGFGPVVLEPDEPVFHAEWERRAFALTLAMGAAGEWNLDQSRSAREDRPRPEYLAMSYYEIWAAGLSRLLLDAGLVSAEELESGSAVTPPAPIRRRLEGAEVRTALRRGGPTLRPAADVALFGVDDVVATVADVAPGHTRLPTYARGKRGRVTAVHGCHVFPDAHAKGLGEQPHWLYTVAFSATELFGPDADPRVVVSIDAFEPYLERS